MRDALVMARGDKSQDDVAKAIGIAQQYLSEIERQNKTPSAKLMSRISQFYGKPVEVLFGDIFLPSNTTKCGIAKHKEAS